MYCLLFGFICLCCLFTLFLGLKFVVMWVLVLILQVLGFLVCMLPFGFAVCDVVDYWFGYLCITVIVCCFGFPVD